MNITAVSLTRFIVVRNMNRTSLSETRRETTYTDVGNADIAGANICHPWWLAPASMRVTVSIKATPDSYILITAS